MVVVVELATVEVGEEDSLRVTVVEFSVEVVSEVEETSSPPSLDKSIELILSLFRILILLTFAAHNFKAGKFHPSLVPRLARRIQPR